MKLKQTLIFQVLDDKTVIVPMGEAAEALHGVLRVNATGAAIIRGLADGLDEEAVAAKIMEDFDGVDRERAENGVRKTVEKLRAAGLDID